jgi:hypothetical protein
MPVSTALQRKLLDRKLRNPLETCLMAEDGVTSQTLLQAPGSLLDGTTPLAALLRPARQAWCRRWPTCRCIRWRSCC